MTYSVMTYSVMTYSVIWQVIHSVTELFSTLKNTPLFILYFSSSLLFILYYSLFIVNIFSINDLVPNSQFSRVNKIILKLKSVNMEHILSFQLPAMACVSPCFQRINVQGMTH